MRYLKKTDWGDYWWTEPGISRVELAERALTQVAHLGVCLQTPPGSDPSAQIISDSLTITRPLKESSMSRGTKFGGE